MLSESVTLLLTFWAVGFTVNLTFIQVGHRGYLEYLV